MSISALSRGTFTARLLTELAVPGFPVGDNSSPTDPYGWQGEPNASSSTFIPYLGLTPLSAQPQRPAGAMADSTSEWQLPYSVWYAGVTRAQSEALADRIREQLINISRERVETPSGAWKIQQIQCSVIGANTRVGSAYPDYYTQADTFQVWVSKERQ